jgi:hypothetical protein
MATELKVIEGGDSAVGGDTWADKVRKEAKDLAGRVDTEYINLARLLYEIYDTPVGGDEKNGPIWTQWGYKSFAEYVQEELGIHKKRAQRLKKIWERLEGLRSEGMDEGVRDRLVQLGFSKIRELVRVVTPKNAEKWVGKAEELSYPHLTKIIRDTLDSAEKRGRAAREVTRDRETEAQSEEDRVLNEGSDTVSSEEVVEMAPEVEMAPPADVTADDMKRLNFMAYNDQADTINQALERAEQLSGSNSKTNNLHLICVDFLATNDFGKATASQKLRLISKLEKALGLHLVAFDEDYEAVYGLKTLKCASEAE